MNEETYMSVFRFVEYYIFNDFLCVTMVPKRDFLAPQVLRNAHGGGRCQIFREKALRRCKVQCY